MTPDQVEDLRRKLHAAPFVVVPPISARELARIEEAGVVLPLVYRAFVTTVASEIDDTKLVHPTRATRHLIDPASAFPNWAERSPGVDVRRFSFSPDDAARAMAAGARWLRERLPPPGPARDLEPTADSTLGRMVFQDDYPVEEVWLRGNDWLEGTLALEDQGCGWEIRLVVDGPLAGTVWHSGDYGWLPHFYVDATDATRAHDFASWWEVQRMLLDV